MNHAALIFADRLLKPIYFAFKWMKCLIPVKGKDTNQYYVIKFFGLGSLTRIVYVLNELDIDKEKVTFITFKKNEALLNHIGMKGYYIQATNPFVFIGGLVQSIGHVWQKKGVKILDMERSSNFSGIFRTLLAIRKPTASFDFEVENHQLGNQQFITLQNKSALQGITELFQHNSTHSSVSWREERVHLNSIIPASNNKESTSQSITGGSVSSGDQTNEAELVPSVGNDNQNTILNGENATGGSVSSSSLDKNAQLFSPFGNENSDTISNNENATGDSVSSSSPDKNAQLFSPLSNENSDTITNNENATGGSVSSSSPDKNAQLFSPLSNENSDTITNNENTTGGSVSSSSPDKNARLFSPFGNENSDTITNNENATGGSVSSSTPDKNAQLFSSGGIENKRVTINPNAGSYLPERMFPLQKFAELVDQLSRIYPHWHFTITGSKNEVNRVNKFEKLLEDKGIEKDRFENLAGKQSLDEMLNTLKASALVISNDSGPIHFARYFGIKTVGVWGPTSAEMVGYPNSEKMLNLIPTETCSPCFLNPKSKVAKQCDGKITCFHNRNVTAMTNEIREFVNSSTKTAIITSE